MLQSNVKPQPDVEFGFGHFEVSKWTKVRIEKLKTEFTKRIYQQNGFITQSITVTFCSSLHDLKNHRFDFVNFDSKVQSGFSISHCHFLTFLFQNIRWFASSVLWLFKMLLQRLSLKNTYFGGCESEIDDFAGRCACTLNRERGLCA